MRAALGVGLVLVAGEAEAHAFAQRYDLPLPLWHYLVGAGAAVALSFVVAAVVLRGGGRLRARIALRLPRWFARGVRRVLGTLAVGAFVLLLAAGLWGAQGDWDSNLLPVAVWVIFWVGLTFVSALVGNVWPLVDPWLALARLVRARAAPPARVLAARNARKRKSAERKFAEPAFAWPRRAGAWPAVLLFGAFAWCELAWSENAVPEKLATLILAWSLLAWAGMALFGVTAWRANADPFARYFGLFARFAPLAVVRGRLIVRPFGAGLRQRAPPPPAVAAFVIVALATVSFDGLSDTPFWADVVGRLSRLLYDAGIVARVGYTATDSLVTTLGLVATPLLFAAVYLATAALVGRIAGEPAGLTARRYVLSLVPIAIGYHLAHYLSYLLIQGQAAWPLLSDPLNRGWDLFGTRDAEIDIGIIGMRSVWLFAVAAIVVGHVAAVTLAHLEALRGAPSRRAAVGSQVPMLVLMVGYTMLSLWILSQPIVEG